MGMVVRTNTSAINANRNLKKNNKKSSSSLEKLASGFKINRAGDDASGLAISEKMKAQITALGTASNNCEDGISLIQTAEGYIGEIHNMLNRMVELSEKSANGILEDSGNTGCSAYGESGGVQNAGTDRAALQLEMDQLCAEIDRIAMTANFNGNKLLYPNDEKVKKDYEENMSHWNKWTTQDGRTVEPYNKYSLQVGETSEKGDKLVLSIQFMTTDALFMKNDKNSGIYDIVSADGSQTSSQTIYISNTPYMNLTEVSGLTQPFKGENSEHKYGCSINISDQSYASKAVDVIREVIDKVSLQRSQLGAMQNRLDYTINNLDTAKENIQSSNSRIRDTDMAEEMMKYTQNNVLTQAAQAMLAQANTQPQNVLQLLQ